MDYAQLIAVFAVVIANLGTVVMLYLHLDNKTNQTLEGMRQQIGAIHSEMKDFHGRLCAIEERNKGK